MQLTLVRLCECEFNGISHNVKIHSLNAYKKCARAFGARLRRSPSMLEYLIVIDILYIYTIAEKNSYDSQGWNMLNLKLYIYIESRLYCGYDIICSKKYKRKKVIFMGHGNGD